MTDGRLAPIAAVGGAGRGDGMGTVTDVDALGKAISAEQALQAARGFVATSRRMTVLRVARAEQALAAAQAELAAAREELAAAREEYAEFAVKAAGMVADAVGAVAESRDAAHEITGLVAVGGGALVAFRCVAEDCRHDGDEERGG